jgi:EpsI family protein
MPETETGPLQFLRDGTARVVTALLFVLIVIFYSYPKAEYIPHPPALSSLPPDSGSWRMIQEMRVDSETMSLLKADDTVSRAYLGPAGPLTFFVAFFKSQRGGVTPHSPKICLPGAGWTPEESSIIQVPVTGIASPIPVNRYVVHHGEDRSLVLYWYATAHHMVADEYLAKLYLMDEGLRYRRSDEAIYRVIVPITARGADAAQREAIAFIRSIYPPLKHQMWSS